MLKTPLLSVYAFMLKIGSVPGFSALYALNTIFTPSRGSFELMSETVPFIMTDMASVFISGALLLHEQKAAIDSSHKMNMYFILCIPVLIP